jgi:hypothetical protein
MPGYRFEIFAADGSAVASITDEVGDELDAVSSAYDLLDVWPAVKVWRDRTLVLSLSALVHPP